MILLRHSPHNKSPSSPVYPAINTSSCSRRLPRPVSSRRPVSSASQAFPSLLYVMAELETDLQDVVHYLNGVNDTKKVHVLKFLRDKVGSQYADDVEKRLIYLPANSCESVNKPVENQDQLIDQLNQLKLDLNANEDSIQLTIKSIKLQRYMTLVTCFGEILRVIYLRTVIGRILDCWPTYDQPFNIIEVERKVVKKCLKWFEVPEGRNLEEMVVQCRDSVFTKLQSAFSSLRSDGHVFFLDENAEPTALATNSAAILVLELNNLKERNKDLHRQIENIKNDQN